MTRLENEKFNQFCQEKGHRGDATTLNMAVPAPSGVEEDYDIFMWKRMLLLSYIFVWIMNKYEVLEPGVKEGNPLIILTHQSSGHIDVNFYKHAYNTP